MSAVWRLVIDDGPAEGAWNMALDRAVQLARQAGDVPPTLRLYRWARPTVTLGRFQDAAGVDGGLCAREGIDVVRRYTGGRGVLHDDELTYSIVVGVDDGVPRGTAASYRMLCSALAETYRLLGVDAALTARPRGDGSSAACYLHATPADLSLGLAKLSGSAQVWTADTVLQHGSFARSRDVAREAAVFRLSTQAARRLAAETTTLADTLGEAPSLERIIDAAVAGVQAALGVRLERGPLTAEELELAAGLLGETSADVVPARSLVRGSM
ncbi:MAG: biotin/lipoate A/B protein ligase family protein [Coriobacteriia bacterium]|nr:biotin/lipoate A/B protein ligase family protein [Coriobacteriia bacterium]